MHHYCTFVYFSDLCEVSALRKAAYDVQHLGRGRSDSTLPGRFRAGKLRAAVDTCCDWSVLRKAALDITLVVGWLMLLAHPPTSPLRMPTERGCLQSSTFSRGRLEAGPAASLFP
jgi:hypothetical protein